MIVLGRTNDEKGTQLEKLTSTILYGLGYENVILNQIGAGGAELDLTAEYVTPVPGAEVRRRIVCECKARQDPANMTDWLKFLGKLHVIEVERNEEVLGCFVSLSGVNGPVSGSFESYSRSKRTKVTLLTEEGILKLIGPKYGIARMDQVAGTVAQLTNRTAKAFDLAYYDYGLFWIVTFDGGAYTILSAMGHPIVGDLSLEISSLVEVCTALTGFVDLLGEAEAQRVTDRLQKNIIVMLASRGGSVPVATTVQSYKGEVPKQCPAEVPHNDLNRIMSLLTERGWIEVREQEQCLSLRMDEYGRCPDIVDILRFMLSGDVTSEVITGFIGTPFYDRHVDRQLVSEIQRIQGDVPLTDNQIEKLISVLRLSPSALVESLRPNQFIIQHRTGDSTVCSPEIDEDDALSLLNLAFECLHNDFRNRALMGYLYKTRGLRELESYERIRVKSRMAVELEGEVFGRLRIGLLAEKYGGSFVGLFALEGSSQPWEGTEPDEAFVDKAYRRTYSLPEQAT